MEDLLGVILEFLGEVLIELLMAGATDVLARAAGQRATRGGGRRAGAVLRRLFVEFHRMGVVLGGAVFVLLGIGAGLLSLGLFPHPIFGTHRFHGASLLISPIVAGFGMSLIGWMVRRRGGRRARIETFRYGFVFALAMAIVRFLLVARP